MIAKKKKIRLQIVDQYIEQVSTGKRVAGKYEKLAVDRFLKDLQRDDLYFDADYVKWLLDLFQKFRFTNGKWKGKHFKLEPFQAFILANAYGFKRKRDDLRRFNKVYKKIARKNGKTEFLAAVANFGLIFDKENSPEIYWAATKRDQAKIGWRRQKVMIEQMMAESKYVKKRFATNQSRIFGKLDTGFSFALGRDSKSEDGLSPHYALIDEYHSHPDDGLLNVLESGMGAREQPLTWIITTAGFNYNSACKQFEDVCKKVLEGQIESDQVFAIIYDIDEDDDWEDELTWQKANPCLGTSLNMEFMRSEFRKAKTEGKSKETSFKTKNLNIWLKGQVGWIPVSKWDKLALPGVELDQMKGRTGYMGFDLSSTYDISAVAIFFPSLYEKDKPKLLIYYFCPDERSYSDEYEHIYKEWAAQDHIVVTPGSSIDQDYIKTFILSVAETVDIKKIGYDKWQSNKLATELMEDGAKVESFGQTVSNFNEPLKYLEKLIIDGNLEHDGNPVSSWMFGNCSIYTNTSGLRKIIKQNESLKIDGFVAAMMALGMYLNEQNKEIKSVYESG
jgi:phage terminase large subunit-like protein